jgi:glucose uptake protein
MFGLLYALITVMAWGTWLAPSQNVPLKNQQVKTFYVAAANLVIAFLAALSQGLDRLTWPAFWGPFLGGIVWSISGLCAFNGAKRIGIAKAFGIWAPLNIIVSLICGRVFFREFTHLGTAGLALLFVAIVVIITGVLMIIYAKDDAEKGRPAKTLFTGVLWACGAGVLWGIYFIPIKLSGVSMWIGALPMAIGMFVGSGLLVLLARQSLLLERAEHYLRLSVTGLLWTVGNFGMLLLVDLWGAGKGFTIAQLSVVVNALVGIYWLKDPQPRTRAATMTLIGCALATLGGIILGRLK